jgi:tetratricopeptide (TPR) repeat protein
LRQQEREKLNKKLFAYTIKKAAVTVCLFLFCNLLYAQEFRFDAGSKLAYEHTLRLRFQEAKKIIPNPKTPQEVYVIALAETLELILAEDETKREEYEANFEQRRNRIFKHNADEMLLQTEMHLQWAFVYLKFGSELDAALQLRQAYQSVQEIRKHFPNYKAVLKTAGLLNVMIGSVPEKYNWILSLLSIEGSVPQGLNQMKQLMNSAHDFAFESTLWYAFIQGFILQKPELAIDEMNGLLMKAPDHPMATFLNISFYFKNSANEDALRLLKVLEGNESIFPVPYLKYLKGEAFLHKGEYENAIASYNEFIENYNGQNFLKDAYFKTGLCYWLQGKQNEGQDFFHRAKTIGQENTEADKNAAKTIALPELPPVQLIKIRYFTDGGYYNEARSLLDALPPTSLTDKKSRVEYYYRHARLAHKMKDLDSAKTFYKKTIELNEASEWYFAPNSCLQLGYIYMEGKNKAEAKYYFEKSLQYKRHEYKNSIDSKARSALAQLNGRK